MLIDSIQTLRTERVESAPGSVAQVRECAALLAATAKTHGTALVLVGHVTKEGTLAGPRVLEHLVDVVLSFEGERGHPFRLLRATKNRFGSTQEVGVFTMGERGLDVVENPSELFLAERHAGAPGSCIVPVLEGSRPMLLEVQALVAPAGYGTARRTCLGIDDARVALLLAVLDRRSDVDLLSCDVYVNVAGGVRVAEPAADLAVALALASSRLDLPLPADVAACGEIGLGGEIRRVARLEERAARGGAPRLRACARPRTCVAACAAGDATPDRRGRRRRGRGWLRRNVHARVNDRSFTALRAAAFDTRPRRRTRLGRDVRTCSTSGGARDAPSIASRRSWRSSSARCASSSPSDHALVGTIGEHVLSLGRQARAPRPADAGAGAMRLRPARVACRSRPPSSCCTPRRCCTTTSWTSPSCAAGSRRRARSGATGARCWSATSSTRAPRR